MLTFLVRASSLLTYSRIISNNCSANGTIYCSTWKINEMSVSSNAECALNWFCLITVTILSAISCSSSPMSSSLAFWITLARQIAPADCTVLLPF